MSIALDLVYALLAIVAAPWWMRKTRGGWPERFGRIEALPAKQRPRILIHAVSVGEVNLIRRLVARLSEDVEVVVSVSTDTGIARAQQAFADRQPGPGRIFIVRYPVDFSRAVTRFLNAVQPDAAALVELELWPNFLRACSRRGIPVAIINGRLSDRSAPRYARARPLMGRFFRSLALVAAQDDGYRDRFVAAGASPDRTLIAGSMKWDSAEIADSVPGADELAREMGIDRSKPLIVAGSTAPDEHNLLHRATPPGVQLLCAPRRPEWFEDAARDLPGCIRRSTGASPQPSTSDRFLLDTIGELRKAYALADVVVVGRSFADLYGSDPMEPAALGKPVVIGPAVADFRTIVSEMLARRAIIQTDRDELPSVLRSLLANEDERRAQSARARECVRAKQGSTERHAALLLDLLRRAPKAP